MSFDISEIESAVAASGRAARILVAKAEGSTPREAGASMMVWEGGQSGTIGGGALEWEAAKDARRLLSKRTSKSALLTKHPLGPGLGQCCGGAVTLLTEVFDDKRLESARKAITDSGSFARAADNLDAALPASVEKMLRRMGEDGEPGRTALTGGWVIEPVSAPTRHVWLYGAGHVGLAIARALAPLPDLSTTWVDVSKDRFPEDVPANARILAASHPPDAVPHAPDCAEHLVLTFSHALDLEICSRILSRPFRSAGLIGSDTKWARFRKRLIEAGHSASNVDRIQCPIGDPSLGKHPWAIAVGVAASLLSAGGASCQVSESAAT